MRADQRGFLDQLLRAAGAGHERELPGNAQRAARMLVRLWPSEISGVVALLDYARGRGYVDALADVDALGAATVDVRGLPETPEPGGISSPYCANPAHDHRLVHGPDCLPARRPR